MKQAYAGEWLSEFVAGATQPSIWGIGGAFGVVLACFAACTLFVTPEFLVSHDYGYLLANEEDEYARLTWELLWLRQLPEPVEGVALVGSSSVREAISDANGIARNLEQRVSRPIDVLSLNVAGLRLWEKAQACLCLEDRLKGVVVIQIDPLDLSLDPEFHSSFVRNPRLAAGFEAFDAELEAAAMEAPRRTGNYFIDNFGFFAARPDIVLNLLTGPKRVTAHFAETWRPLSPEEIAAAIDHHKWEWRGYERNRKHNFETYRRMIARLQSKGIEVVLLEGIRNREYDDEVFDTPEAQALLRLYESEVRQFADELGIMYLDLYEESDLSGPDFTDTAHVRNGPARERFTRVLSRRLAGLLKKALDTPSPSPHHRRDKPEPAHTTEGT